MTNSSILAMVENEIYMRDRVKPKSVEVEFEAITLGVNEEYKVYVVTHKEECELYHIVISMTKEML